MELIDVMLYVCVFLLGLFVGRLLMAVQYSVMLGMKSKSGSIKPKLEL